MTMTDDTRALPLTPPDPAMTPAERIWDAVHHIEAHPEKWHMSHWGRVTECGTTYCLAGQVVVRAGYRMVPDADEETVMSVVALADLPHDIRDASDADLRSTDGVLADGSVGVDWLAERLLGIDPGTGCELWYLPTDISVVRARVAEIFGPDPRSTR